MNKPEFHDTGLVQTRVLSSVGTIPCFEYPYYPIIKHTFTAHSVIALYGTLEGYFGYVDVWLRTAGSRFHLSGLVIAPRTSGVPWVSGARGKK